jgi:molybdopterin synthase catalytic subunit
MFTIVSKPLERLKLGGDLSNPAAGAFVSFEGWVRNWNENKEVLSLEYECYHVLAMKEGVAICDEAIDQFDILEARCVHRVGRIAPGEMAVWVGVTAEHRQAAFEACEHVIDQVKRRVPIWKKEHYRGGDSGWVHCPRCSSRTEEIIEIKKPEFGSLLWNR